MQTYLNATVLPCKELPDGRSGGGIISEAGEFLKESTVHNGSHVPYKFESAKHSDETVIYFGMLIGVWGHCFTDCIKRAWFFHCDEYQEKYSGLKVIYTAHEGALHKNFLDLFAKSGVDIKSFYEVKEPTVFKEIIIPDSSFWPDDERNDHFTKEYRECIDRIKAPYAKQKKDINKKVYYSHRDVRGFNNDIGEEKIERYLTKNGFEIVHPEHSEVIIILRSPYMTFHQLALNELYEEQKIYYVDSSLSILCKADRPTRRPFFYYVSKELVRHVEGRDLEETDGYLKDNFRDFRKYLRRGLYIEKDRTFTAYSPYTEKAAYYYNRYLYANKLCTSVINEGRKIEFFTFRCIKKAKSVLFSRH